MSGNRITQKQLHNFNTFKLKKQFIMKAIQFSRDIYTLASAPFKVFGLVIGELCRAAVDVVSVSDIGGAPETYKPFGGGQGK